MLELGLHSRAKRVPLPSVPVTLIVCSHSCQEEHLHRHHLSALETRCLTVADLHSTLGL